MPFSPSFLTSVLARAMRAVHVGRRAILPHRVLDSRARVDSAIAPACRAPRLIRVLAVAALAGNAAFAYADQIDNHDALVAELVNQFHATPLVADCAAHAAFVVPTSPIYDHVEFLPSALDAQHAGTESWGQPFDDRKQRITVDTMVTVSGLGYRKQASESTQPDLLNFRCGYVADKLLAFAYNEPEQTPVPRAAAPAARSVARGRHGVHGTNANRTHGRAAHGRSPATTTKRKAATKKTPTRRGTS